MRYPVVLCGDKISGISLINFGINLYFLCDFFIRLKKTILFFGFDLEYLQTFFSFLAPQTICKWRSDTDPRENQHSPCRQRAAGRNLLLASFLGRMSSMRQFCVVVVEFVVEQHLDVSAVQAYTCGLRNGGFSGIMLA